MNTQNTLRQWLSAGDILRVVRGLRALASAYNDRELSTAVVVQEGRFHALESSREKGVASFAELNLERARIREALLHIIETIPDFWSADVLAAIPPSEGSRKTSSVSRKKIAVAALLTMLAGLAAFSVYNLRYFLDNNQESAHALAIWVLDQQGKPLPELQHTGRLVIRLCSEVRTPLIGENGLVAAGPLPDACKGQAIGIALQADGYVLQSPDSAWVPDGAPLYLYVRRDDSLARIRGSIEDEKGRPVANAIVTINQDTSIVSDSLGLFEITLPERMRIRDKSGHYNLRVRKGDLLHETWYYPASSAIQIRLTR